MLLRALTQFGYLAIVGLLTAGGLGFPVPEELVQLTAGYLARLGYLDLSFALAACYGGIVLGDFLFFKLAQRHGESILDRVRAHKLLTARRRSFLESHFARHAFLTIVVARHTSGFRLAAYALAATHGVRARTFLLADALSAALSVPLVVSAAYLFAAHLDAVKRRVQQIEIVLLAAVALSVVAYLFVWHRRRSRLDPAGAAARPDVRAPAEGCAGPPGPHPPSDR